MTHLNHDSDAPPEVEATPDGTLREIAAVAPLMVALVFFGFFPKPLLETSNPYVADLMIHVGVTDDEPTVALAEEAGR